MPIWITIIVLCSCRWASGRTMPFPDLQQDLTDTSASLANGNITVFFTRLLRTNDTTRDITLTSDRNNCVYFLPARGTVSNVTARTINQRSMTDRYISMERVCLCSGATRIVTGLLNHYAISTVLYIILILLQIIFISLLWILILVTAAVQCLM